MGKPLLQISYSLATIGNVADQLWQCAHQYRVWAFSGGMGAGKTTFIHYLCDFLAVEDAVSSPTFSLINEYHFVHNGADKVIYHMDWYRLRDTQEAVHAGMEDALMQEDAYCFIEWAEKATGILPYPHLLIELEQTETDERKMTVHVR